MNSKVDPHVFKILDNRIFRLFVLPTEKCNFRCTYCYEDFLIGAMPLEIREGVKLFISKKTKNLQAFYLSWFGGEPLLRKSDVLNVSHHARIACDASDTAFFSDMTTNGYLLDLDCFLELLDSGVKSFQISLDGFPRHHDKTRKLANGNGTFEKIIKNLDAITTVAGSQKFTITLRCHYSAETLLDLPDFAAFLADRYKEGKFVFFPKRIEQLGGPNDKFIEPFDVDFEAEYVQEAIKRYGASPDKILKSNLEICYAALANSILIRADGRISKCTVAFDDDRNTIGMLEADGTLTIDQPAYRAWLGPALGGNEAAMHCPLAFLPALASKRIFITPTLSKF